MTFVTKTMRPADYESTYTAMRDFTDSRTVETPDEIWLCEHPSIYTLGLAGKPEHLLHSNNIPIIQTNRGGQVTYHGPGQVIAYVLMDMRRRNYFVKEYVHRLERAAINVLQHYGIEGFTVEGAPGIYVKLAPSAPPSLSQSPSKVTDSSPSAPPNFTGLAKIAALGVKVTNHCTYHGLSLNVDMNLTPFTGINPCGYSDLAIADFKTMGIKTDKASWNNVANLLAENLVAIL